MPMQFAEGYSHGVQQTADPKDVHFVLARQEAGNQSSPHYLKSVSSWGNLADAGGGQEHAEPVAHSYALHEASRRGKKEMLWRLVNEEGFDPNEQRHDDAYTPLHVACRHGHAGSAQYLLQMGCTIETQDYNARTPLHLSALYGHALTCALLARWHADIEAKDSQGCTALHLAAVYGHAGACGLLLDHKAYVDAPDFKNRSALRCAAQYAHFGTVKLLIERQADLDFQDSKGTTALRAAVQYGHYGTALALLQANATVDLAGT